jgi:hypothetical protein
MHSPYAYASKKDLLEWVARMLDMDLTSLDDVRLSTPCWTSPLGHVLTREHVMVITVSITLACSDACMSFLQRTTVVFEIVDHAQEHHRAKWKFTLLFWCSGVRLLLNHQAVFAVDQRSCLGPIAGCAFRRCRTHAKGTLNLAEAA